jgi:hypothetical protein
MAIAMPLCVEPNSTFSARRNDAGRRSWQRRIASVKQVNLIEYLDLLNKPQFHELFRQLWSEFVQRTANDVRLDKTDVFNALEALKSLPADWSGSGAVPIDRQVIRAAELFILSLPSNVTATPRVMPMMGGRLQFEWHRGNRSLELEFESSDRVHYLKWDSDAGVEEEDVISVEDMGTVHALLQWFASESENA